MSEKLYSIKESTMTNMADTIRQITGTTGPITGEEVSDYVVANLPNSENLDEVLEDQDDIIAQIQTMLQGKAAGGGEFVLQDKTITPTTSKQIVTADSGYDGLDTVTVNAMPTATQATPSITVSSAGLITANSTQSAGYVASGTKSATKQLTTQAAKTITPSTSSQTAVASGRYTTGAVTVAAIPSNYEDVGTETNTYTTKLASLETAVTALETELAGKASGGSDGGSIESWTGTITKSGVLGSMGTFSIHYMDQSLTPQVFSADSNDTYNIEIAAGTFITCLNYYSDPYVGDCGTSYVFVPSSNNFTIDVTG